MKCEHLGVIVEIEPRQATVENRCVRMLYKHRSGVRQPKLFELTGSGRLGREVFERAIQRLAEAEILVRQSTNHENSFVLKLTPWGEAQAETLEATLAMQKEAAVKPRTPEAA